MGTALRHRLATSGGPVARLLRAARRTWSGLRLPLPRVVGRAYLAVFVALREVVYLLRRVLVAEPLTRAYCTTVGRDFRTDIYVPWVQGRGRLIVGDDVRFQGKLSFTFAARFSASPTITIGDHTRITHGTLIVCAMAVTIGRNVRIARGVEIRDSSGHPADAVARRRGDPPSADEVRPVVIGDDAWIGSGAVLMPGTELGNGVVVASHAVVSGRVEPYTLVAGNPARRVRVLANPEADPTPPDSTPST